MKKKYHLLIQHMKANKGVYLLGLISVVICNILQVYFAVAMGHVIDFFSNKPDATEFFLFYTKKRNYSKEKIFLIIFYSILTSRIVLTLARVGWRITMARQTHLASGFLKNEIWLNARYFKFQDLMDKYSKGILMNAANSDVGQARFLFGFTLVGVIDVLFLGVFTVVSMFQINLNLSILSLLLLSIIPVLVKKLSKKEMESYDDAQNALGNFNDLATQAVSTVKLQKLGKISLFWFKRLYQSSHSYMNKRLHAQSISLQYIPFMGLSSIISYILLFSYGLYLNIQGKISVGEFVSMQGLIFLLQDPLMELGFIISEWRKASTSLERLNEIFRHESEEYLKGETQEKLERTSLVYDIKNLSFSYQDNLVIDNFSIQVKENSKLGITGSVGSGKTTLINILAGLERNFSGQLSFHQKSFNEYDHKFLRSHIVVLHQQAFLFADTIKNNIQVDRRLSDDEIWHYLELAGLKDDIKNFKNGIDTYLGEWGINLSGGQKQRLTLARALAKEPEVLLLDDALSAVDTVTEDKILQNLNRYLKNATIIWVAHRRSTLKYCESVINMDDL